jgi:hypothetical protein
LPQDQPFAISDGAGTDPSRARPVVTIDDSSDLQWILKCFWDTGGVVVDRNDFSKPSEAPTLTSIASASLNSKLQEGRRLQERLCRLAQ